MKKITSLLLFLPIVAVAQTDWEHVGTSTKQDKFYLRNVTQKDDSKKINFWIKMQRPDKIEKDDTTSFKAGDYTITKYEGNCSEMTYRTLGGAVYDRKGNSKTVLKEAYISNVVIPDSIAETFLQAACSKIIY